MADLSFSYGKASPSLAGVSLTVAPAELVCLLGPNGAGKTTLLRCLLGLLTPERGTIRIAGVDIAGLSARKTARLVAYVPQQSTHTFPFTALDVAVMGRTPHLRSLASPSNADRRHALRVLDSVGIANLAQRPFLQLSGGQRQLTLLARALVQEAELLILDEPTAALDYGNEVRTLNIVRRLTATGRSVLMTTHQPNHALLCADRAVLLGEGRILADGPPPEVITAASLSALYGVAVDVLHTPMPGRADTLLRTCVPLLDPTATRQPRAVEHSTDTELVRSRERTP